MTNQTLNPFYQAKILTKPVIIASVVLAISMLLFMTLNANGNWDFVLPFRFYKLMALILVGVAIGVSTLLFQTLTHNPILTPALLGFDALYVLIQSVLVFALGAVNIFTTQPLLKFFLEIMLMVIASMLMFRLLFNEKQQNLSRLILVGIIFGVLFRSLSSLIARLINPEDFVVVQSASFAQFNTIDKTMMWVSLAICAVCLGAVWRWRHQVDILMLGKSYAINLGIDYQKLALRLLIIIAILVATATAFVGPVIFLGLLVCALTNKISQQMYHTERLILVSLISVICLVLGQTIFEQVLGMAGVLAVVIELFGGIVFIILMLNRYKKAIA
nr:iron chelate uptake ABC transporter family permease subunit [uncultured Moraxella sp.]